MACVSRGFPRESVGCECVAECVECVVGGVTASFVGSRRGVCVTSIVGVSGGEVDGCGE